MDQATEITKQLYLGPLGVARQRETLHQLNITAVVCVAAEGRAYFPRDFAYWESAGDPIVEHTCHCHDVVGALDQVWDFVSSHTTDVRHPEEGRVYVHCVHGRTRSAAVVTYLVAKMENTTIAEAYERLRTKRDVFVPDAWLQALQDKLSADRSGLSQNERGKQ